jgi:MFS family permease
LEGAVPGQQRALWIVALAELLGTSLWLSGTAAIPALTEAWRADLSAGAWLTMSVQLGFVAGALVAAVFNLPDIFHAPRFFALCAVLAAVTNAAFAWLAADHMWTAFALRFLTGATMAGVYPVGMKILSGWFRDGRGTALGVLVGALTVGKGMPYLLEGAGHLPWRGVVLASSVLALAAAALVGFFVREGPYSTPAPPVDFRQAGAILHNRPLRLANFGYFGHMWELYSMWGWVALLLAASAGTAGHAALGDATSAAGDAASAMREAVPIAAFFAIAAGFIGCYWAGRVSDAPMRGTDAHRLARRARVTIWAMGVSGACCLLAAAVFQHFWVLVGVCFVWGVAVVADSAQFSTIVSEVSDRRYIGTALALQTALGFLLTVVAIRATGAIASTWGWRWAAASMAIGPALGIVAMLRLTRIEQR